MLQRIAEQKIKSKPPQEVKEKKSVLADLAEKVNWKEFTPTDLANIENLHPFYIYKTTSGFLWTDADVKILKDIMEKDLKHIQFFADITELI